MVRYLAARVWNSFWLLPVSLTVLAIALAIFTRWVDSTPWGDGLNLWPGEVLLGTEGAREVVSTIAGAMMTAASLVVSMTLVALSLANNSAGPRTLGELMRQRSMQVTLGMFLAAFVYALLVLRTIFGAESSDVPNLSVATAIGLAIFAFFWLVYFVQALSRSMQTDTIVARAAADLVKAIEADAPDHANESPVYVDYGEGLHVESTGHGYIDLIDVDALLAAACKHDGFVRLHKRPGHFVVCGELIASVYGDTDGVREALTQCVHDSVLRSDRRTSTQDLEYRVHLLVEIAGRALSAGINDFYTSIACIDHLAGALSIAARQGLRDPEVRDETGQVRVLRYPMSHIDLIDSAFKPIRQFASTNVPATLRVLEALTQIVNSARDRATAEAIEKHAKDMAQAALPGMHIDTDKQALLDRMAAFSAAARQAHFLTHTPAD